MSSTGHCFDIGIATRAALARFERSREPYCGSADPRTAGNGSIMRLAPCRSSSPATRCRRSNARPRARARRMPRRRRWMAAAISARSWSERLRASRRRSCCSRTGRRSVGYWDEHPLARGGGGRCRFVRAARAAGDPRERLCRPLARGGALGAAPDGLVQGWCAAAVNLGEDADTTGAVYGQLAGALYGAEAIPVEWRERLALRELIERLSDRLQEAASS